MTPTLISTHPRFHEHPDDGCWVAPHCLTCHLPRCILDEPGAAVRMLKAARWQRVREALEAGLGPAEAAQRVGVSVRSIYHVKAQGRARP